MSDRRAVLESIAYGDDPKVSPRDRLQALEQLLAFEPVKAGPDGPTEEQIWSEIDSSLEMGLAAAFVAAGPDATPEELRHCPRFAKCLREVVDREVTRELGNIALRDEAKREERAREQRDADDQQRGDVIDAESVDVPVSDDVALPAPRRRRELPAGLDPAAGWPRDPGPGFSRPGRR